MNNPEIGWKSDFMLVLSHLLDEDCRNDYAEAVILFRESGKEIYLDNGLFENHEPESGESLLRKAELIGATYVFAPDHLYNAQKTRESFEEFKNLRNKLNVDVKLAYVVQADNPLDYLNEYKWAEENEDIDLIWQSILSIPKSFEQITQTSDITLNRVVCIKILEDFIKPKKDAHLLGLGSSLGDITYAKHYPYIISNDTSSAFQNGLFGRWYILDENEEFYEVDWGKVEEKVNFDLKNLSEKEEKQIKENVLKFKEIVW